MKKVIFLLFFCLNLTVVAQQNTLKFPENGESPKANLSEYSWIEGHWKGEAFAGITEEIWSPALGGSMMFVFKLVVDNEVQFYEVGGIREINNTLLMQLKHFNNDFKGWEEKNETVDFKLVKAEKNTLYFDELTFEKINENEMNVYVVVSQKDGSTQEVKFNYKKQL